MNFKKSCFLPFLLLIQGLFAQQVELLEKGPKVSFRGLSVVDDKIVWASGAKGTVGRSQDGGKKWEWMTVPGYEKCDFRDIEAFSKDVAIIMAVAEPAYILKTVDGGKSWKKVYENSTRGMFLDAMDFWDQNNGLVVGDPVNGVFFLAKTSNGGESWEAFANYFPADSGEACFASSGTNIRLLTESVFKIVTGGTVSSVLTGALSPSRSLSLEFQNSLSVAARSGNYPNEKKSSSGANSIAGKDIQTMVVVGGDFTEPALAARNCIFTKDGGKTWSEPAQAPGGYRSCVEYLWDDTWICCGLNGVDISKDGGLTWKNISSSSFHVCRRAKKGKAVYLIGNDGLTGKLKL